MGRKVFFVFLAILSSGPMAIQPTLGKEYPTKPIEVLVGQVPGGSMDLIPRLVAVIAPKFLGQPLVVVNKPGAGGSVAAAEVISSKPDGYKLFTTTNAFFSMTTKTQKIPFDPNLLTPLVTFIEFRLGICVRSDAPWKTLSELIDYARKNPGKLRWAHFGRGTSAHIAPLLIFRKAGVETTDVPYKGGAEISAALLGGHVDAAEISYGDIRDHVRAGKIRYLVYLTDRRYSDSPDVPSAVELGFPDAAKLTTYIGLFIHKDTAEEAKSTLIEAFRKTYEDPEFIKGIEKLGNDPRFGGPEFMKEAIKKSEEVSIPILKEFGLYVGK